jgi:hypothetical protein
MVQDVMDVYGTMDEDTQEQSIGLDEFKNAWTDLGGLVHAHFGRQLYT